MIRMGDWVSPIPFTFMPMNWGRRHTNMVWTQKPHTGWTEARNQLEALFTVREQHWKLTHRPPASEKLLYNLVYCKRAHFIWFLSRHRAAGSWKCGHKTPDTAPQHAVSHSICCYQKAMDTSNAATALCRQAHGWRGHALLTGSWTSVLGSVSLPWPAWHFLPWELSQCVQHLANSTGVTLESLNDSCF